jgi:hypothetical protein
MSVKYFKRIWTSFLEVCISNDAKENNGDVVMFWIEMLREQYL